MAVAAVFDHPVWAGLPPAARGMVWSVLETYYRSGCVSLPTTGTDWFTWSRAHRSTFVAYKAQIMQVVHDAAPAIHADYAERSRKRHHMLNVAKRGGAAAAAVAASRRLTDHSPRPPEPFAIPIREPGQGPTPKAHEHAIAANLTPTPPAKRFRQSPA